MTGTGKYWFRAKRYGWGWGLPLTWQGWLVLAVYVLSICLVAVFFEPHGHPFAFAGLVILATLALSAVCWLKGEPPRWRWGKERE
ncbi:hypothetical protein M3A49_23750 [Paraburkholderia sp. CNPSo 3076]|uniref:hypothetical protein n=1 Tax=Paraburkholderia sp. CNPSo 3076 TaxID=2940936 RepID=UPI00224EB38F|nr:hypothetical protein [Paraburkholderia sp. CNPSo 3076]MCX5542474.1 hypothetical protein [Paraburkholderia sp. CNPSo 3076]